MIQPCFYTDGVTVCFSSSLKLLQDKAFKKVLHSVLQIQLVVSVSLPFFLNTVYLFSWAEKSKPPFSAKVVPDWGQDIKWYGQGFGKIHALAPHHQKMKYGTTVHTVLTDTSLSSIETRLKKALWNVDCLTI